MTRFRQLSGTELDCGNHRFWIWFFRLIIPRWEVKIFPYHDEMTADEKLLYDILQKRRLLSKKNREKPEECKDWSKQRIAAALMGLDEKQWIADESKTAEELAEYYEHGYTDVEREEGVESFAEMMV